MRGQYTHEEHDEMLRQAIAGMGPEQRLQFLILAAKIYGPKRRLAARRNPKKQAQWSREYRQRQKEAKGK